MRLPMTISAATAMFLGAASLAYGQTPPAAPGAEPDAVETDPAQARAARKPQPKPPAGPAPPSIVTVANATANQAWLVEITAEGQSVRLPKALAAKASATMKLPKLNGCTVSVVAGFVGGGQVEVEEFDVCKEKTIRFTE